jgi:predicted PurR-regulated permease PerM
MTKKLIGIGLAVMAALLMLVVLWQLRIVVIYVLISLLVSSALRPLVKRLSGLSFFRRLSWVLLYILGLAGFIFLIFTSGRAAFTQIQILVRNLAVLDTWRVPYWLKQSLFNQVVVARLPPPSIFLEAVTGDEGQHVISVLFGLSRDIGSMVTGFLVILFMSIYWSINQIHFERLWLSLLPSAGRKQTRGIWRTIEPEMGAYIRSQVIISLIAGVVLGLGYRVLGSPYSALLAIIGGVSSFVPVVGIPFSVIAALLLGMMTSAQHGLAGSLFTLITLLALSIWIRQKFYDRRWENLILTVVMLIILADAFGLVGIILAPPLSVIIQILWTRLVTRRVESGTALKISDLKQRMAQLLEVIGSMEEPTLPLVTSSVQRLAALIVKADIVLNETPSSNIGPTPLDTSLSDKKM